MSLLGSINVDQKPEGARVVIVAGEKIGKTTLACGAPGALLIPCEIGYGNVRVAKTDMVKSFDEVTDLLDDLKAQCVAHEAQGSVFPYKTLIFDTGTALEKFIHQEILEADPDKKATMPSTLGGFGKGYEYANGLFFKFLAKCDLLAVYHGINIVVTCHTMAVEIVDPTAGSYSSWDINLHSPKNMKTQGKREAITQWADVIGFLYEPILVAKGKDGDINRGVAGAKGRMLGMSRTPGYVAGNRFGVVGELAIPEVDGWNVLADAVYKASGKDLYYRPPVAVQPV